MLDPSARDHYDAEHRAAAEALAARAPRPARVGNVSLGTASWTDPTLLRSGLFYPPDCKTAEARLRFYAARFPIVEVDATYYALPRPSAVLAWRDRTPPDFRFHVKAWAGVTGHGVDLATLPQDMKAALPAALRPRRRALAADLPPDLLAEGVRRFREALQPLHSKLSSVLLQMPPWWTATRGAARALRGLRDLLPDLPLSLEVRHRSWVDPARLDRVLSLLRDLRMHWVIVDTAANTEIALPPVEALTSDLAVIRFHGRNPRTFAGLADSAAERFDWLYDTAELRGWKPRIERLSAEADSVHALMNNCTYDAGVLGAAGLAAVLSDATGPSP